MISVWSNQEIVSILGQLDQRRLPFSRYTLFREDGSCSQLGSGSFAVVYDAMDRSRKKACAIKVMGFGEKYVEPEEFDRTMTDQKLLSRLNGNVVRIYDHAQLFVWLDEHDRVLRAEPYSAAAAQEDSGNRILLQFAVMEKLIPVLSGGRYGAPEVTPRNLVEGDENEVLRLGMQIGNALSALHGANMLHRDIKLENIFYDSVRNSYKLGDFGIAKTTQNGLASTVAFTKGYGAPEIVGTLEDRYDCTADIYSLGMVLFVLLNGLRFPGSDRYRVNASAQYCPGYVLPDPIHGSEGFARVISAMCSFSPDERPQSMKEVLADFNRLGLTPVQQNRDIHLGTMVAVSAVFLLSGAGMFLVSAKFPESTGFLQGVPWLPPLLISLGIAFIGQTSSLRSTFDRGGRRNLSGSLWVMMLLLYVELILLEMIFRFLPMSDRLPELITVTIAGLVRRYQAGKIGLGGLLVCGLWMLRERWQMKNGREYRP